MLVEYKYYSMASLVNGADYGVHSSELLKKNKKEIVLKNGLRFSWKGYLINNKDNAKLAKILMREAGIDTLYFMGIEAILTDKSLEELSAL